ncbi:MAG: carbamoyltransferase [Candidatus Magasanikbacteria bacterium]|nr:carbamoyltransferase [Candidatus Magasanikbacteria bacterium]
MSKTAILGVSCFYHDAAAALVVDGKVVAAAQEERFTRVKHDAEFPQHAIAYCLEAGGIKAPDLSAVIFYEKPILKLDRLLHTYLQTWPRGWRSFLKAMDHTFHATLRVESLIRKNLKYRGPVLFSEHHYSHAASAYYCSGFPEATVVTMDGVGEWDTTTIGYGNGSRLTLSKTIHFPNSLGLLYSALTYYLGFKVNSAEYKVMGLAPYGDPERYAKSMRELIDLKPDGSYRLNQRYFSFPYGLTMTNRAFDRLFGGPARAPESPLTQREKDIAAALQQITEEVVLKIVAHAQAQHPSKNLCLAGGVALNCVANGKILRTGQWDNIYLQPAAGDAGGAVGAALLASAYAFNCPPAPDTMPTAYLGPEYSDQQVLNFLRQEAPERIGGAPLIWKEFPSSPALAERLAELLDHTNNVIGLFQGRMEFGPRALGNRSIIADARVKENWQKVNLKIKFRESFRPFAPVVLEDRAREYFDLPCPSPYMLLVAPVKTDTIPAVTHVDGSARIQTVNQEQNPALTALLEAYARRTGCAVLINTSFNVRGEPIVESPADAFNCFLNTEMDYLALNRYLISKSDNPALARYSERERYLGQFALD